ncbi:hypothetical protein GCM10009836_09450 [Pseudonocardia ailaonensis]|uniref:Uncharacterized protein n=1 Tax=Pseudonocardia ailaonensis TaxID=367279 RepID=A0ABN2MP81_9PSEU
MDDIARSAGARPSHCTLCSTPRTTGDARGLAWSSHHTDGVVSWVCGPCTRLYVFEFETNLPVLPARLPVSA